jgi:hypothetical protein
MNGGHNVMQLPTRRPLLTALNTRFHRSALVALGILVVGHWVEHLVQAWQVWGLDWPRERSLGLLGLQYPWLVKSEQLHYWIALIMLFALAALRPGFTGQARRWWNVALGIQVWHHLEHLLLIGQVVLGLHMLGRPAPTSLVQLVLPRVELHLFYNAAVTVPMVVAVWLHTRRRDPSAAAPPCTCSQPLWSRHAA